MSAKAPTSDSSYPRPVGLTALIEALGLHIPFPAVRSFVTRGARRTNVSSGAISEFYPQRLKQDTVGGSCLHHFTVFSVRLRHIIYLR